LPALFSSDRWLLWLGILFVLSVYFFPAGIVGRLRAGAARRSWRSRQVIGVPISYRSLMPPGLRPVLLKSRSRYCFRPFVAL